jgi:hypothetical protein
MVLSSIAFIVCLVVLPSNAWTSPTTTTTTTTCSYSYSSHPWTTTTTARHHRRQQQQLYLTTDDNDNDNDDEPEQEPERERTWTPAADDAIRAAGATLGKASEYGVDWFDQADAWTQAKTMFPVLAAYDNADLRQTYLTQSPSLWDLLVKTPIGPFLLINLVVLATGFSWCDTPFHQDGAQCPPPLL